jgi:hypothetical protein
MSFSYIAMDRHLEEEIKSNKEIRRLAKINKKATLSQARKRTNKQLIKKLYSFNIPIDKDTLREHCKRFLSAEEMSNWVTDTYKPQIKESEIDWVWFCLTILWERWFPDIPNFEMIDDRMQEGYMKLEKDITGGCRIWLDTWKMIKEINKSIKFKTIKDFDNKFRGTQSLFNWVQDVEMELQNAAVREPLFNQECISFCMEFLKLFPDESPNLVKNMKCAIADSYFSLGNKKKTDSLYREWLEKDPQWGWGWIGWSDCYWLCFKGIEGYRKTIIKQRKY